MYGKAHLGSGTEAGGGGRGFADKDVDGFRASPGPTKNQ